MGTENTFLFLCNFDHQNLPLDDQVINDLWSGHWIPNESERELLNQILASKLELDNLTALLNKYKTDDEALKNALKLAIGSFLTFCHHNWKSDTEKRELDQFFGAEWPQDVDVLNKLQRDSEPIYTNISHPELLFFSLHLFKVLKTLDPSLVNLWWYLRSIATHQRVLEDTSATLYSEVEVVVAKLSNEALTLSSHPRLQILLFAEIAQVYLLYGRIQKTEQYLKKAIEIAGLKLELTGVLGKRTKFQQMDLPQLALSSSLDSSIERPLEEASACHPMTIALDDDVRMDKIKYTEKISQAELPGLEQILCLLTVQHLQKAQPKDDLATEELQPYIETVLAQKTGAWATRVAALFIRCKLEANHKRTVERSMQQCEAIVTDKTVVSPTAMLNYLWATGLQPAWTWKQQLADLYLSLGLVKAALELFLGLQLWEDVIVCYTLLQLRHKAADVIREQIAINPTVKLYCLLGDATDEVAYYEKAWEFSNHKSSRAQKHWGNYLYDRKRYEECIPHFEKSVEINSIQEHVWLRLGFAALEMEKWELSAKAYRRYTYLHPNTFEAWNNLAKVYVKQGDKQRAYRALMEALRFNYDNWKLWENVILISMDTGHFEDVLRGVHRLLDIRNKFEDVEVLSILAHAIILDKQDADGNGAARLRKRALELFGRITSIHQNKPEIWQLYADISPTDLTKAQRLLRAYKGFTQNGNWPNNPDTCKKVVELAQSLMEYSLKARQEAEDKDKLMADQQLSSARLTGQAVTRAAEKHDWPEVKEELETLKELFVTVTEYMKSLL